MIVAIKCDEHHTNDEDDPQNKLTRMLLLHSDILLNRFLCLICTLCHGRHNRLRHLLWLQVIFNTAEDHIAHDLPYDGEAYVIYNERANDFTERRIVLCEHRPETLRSEVPHAIPIESDKKWQKKKQSFCHTIIPFTFEQ